MYSYDINTSSLILLIYIHLVKTNKLQPNQTNPEIYTYSVIDLKIKRENYRLNSITVLERTRYHTVTLVISQYN